MPICFLPLVLREVTEQLLERESPDFLLSSHLKKFGPLAQPRLLRRVRFDDRNIFIDDVLPLDSSSRHLQLSLTLFHDV